MDDDVIERKTRKRIYEIYTKDASDFEKSEDYDIYLELREDIILALVEGTDVEKVEAQVAQYKRENEESIHRHRRRKMEAANASFASSLDTLAVQPTSQTPAEKTVRAPQPQPVETGRTLTEEGSLKQCQRPTTSAEWHAMAAAGGWTRHTYYDFVKRQALDNLSL